MIRHINLSFTMEGTTFETNTLQTYTSTFLTWVCMIIRWAKQSDMCGPGSFEPRQVLLGSVCVTTLTFFGVFLGSTSTLLVWTGCCSKLLLCFSDLQCVRGVWLESCYNNVYWCQNKFSAIPYSAFGSYTATHSSRPMHFRKSHKAPPTILHFAKTLQ